MQDAPSTPGHQHQPHGNEAAPQQAAQPPMPEPQAQPAVAHGDYPSDPIKTVRNGLQTFWQNGHNAFWGVVLVQALIAVVGAVFLVIAIIGAVLGALSWLTSSGNDGSYGLMALGALSQLPPEANSFFESLAGPAGSSTIIAVVLICGAIGIGLYTYLQAGVLSLVGTAVIHQQTADFGQVMRTAFKRTGPLFVQGLLLVAVVLAAFILPALLLGVANANAALAVLYLVLVVACVYFAIRLSLAPLALVSLNMGPIESLKYAWQQSKRRSWEILGAVAIIGAVTTAVDIVFSYLSSSLSGAAGASLAVATLQLLVALVFSVLGFAVLAERFSQFRTAGANQATHKISYLPNIAMVVVAIVISMIASGVENSLNPTTNLNPYGLPSTETNLDSNLNDSTLEDELNQYYEDSENLYDSSDLYDSQLQDPDYDPSMYDDSGDYRLN